MPRCLESPRVEESLDHDSATVGLATALCDQQHRPFALRIEFIASQTAERPGRLQGATMAAGDGPSAGKQQSGGKEDSHLGGFRIEGQARQGYVLKEKVMRGTQQPIVEHGRREMYARTRGHDLWGWVSHK
jgi:hypothetical protein